MVQNIATHSLMTFVKIMEWSNYLYSIVYNLQQNGKAERFYQNTESTA